jgi:hypothetical protein
MDTTVACCLCVRNCYNYLPKIFDNLDLLSKEFKTKNFNVVFVYDNCNDNSELLLEEYKNNRDFNVFIVHNKDNCAYQRAIRIAYSRNRCLDVVYNTIKNVDFHFMIDADDVNACLWNIDLIKKYLADDRWDALSFNRSPYYDIWALFYDNYKYHCWGYGNNSVKVVDYMKKDITNTLANLEGDLMECLSAFNGFAIYRTNKFNGITYDGLYFNIKSLISDEERNNTVSFLEDKMKIKLTIDEGYSYGEHCEHVYYHLNAIKKNNVRIRISKYSIY